MNASMSASEMLYYSFLSGAAAVDDQKQYLNRINVFPVRDGDTGTNLMSTLNSIIEETKVDTTVKATVASMADAALAGARGNSGIIFAQFINGVNEAMDDKEELSIHRFAAILKNAVPYVYSGIMSPVEGTMITVIREWVESIYIMKDKVRSFEELMSKTLQFARKSLERTPEQLEVLKKASVLDSGAAGFVAFLEGAAGFLKHKDVGRLKRPSKQVVIELPHMDYHDEVHYRYCTEAMLSGQKLDADVIRKQLGEMGDSVIVAGNPSHMRIHIHSNKPESVMEMLAGMGSVYQQKVDDMVFQNRIMQSRLSDTAIVTDSIADISQELIDRYQIHVIPLPISVDGDAYLDKTTLTTGQLYRFMNRTEGYPSTSQPSIRDIENRLSYLAGIYNNILAVTVSKEMSGTYNGFLQVAESLAESGYPIEVVNSRLNSGAEGLLVLQAARMLAEGRSFKETVDWVKLNRSSTRILVSLDTLKYMVRGGRVSPIKGLAAKLLNLKPIVSIDEQGKGIVYGKAFSSRGNLKKIIDLVSDANEKSGILAYSIVHADNLKTAEMVATRLKGITGKDPEYITEISAVVALNAGIGTVAVSFTTAQTKGEGGLT